MFKLLADVIVNVNTGLNLDLVPILIAGGVLVVAVVLGIVLSQVSKKNKKKKKAQKNNEDK